MRIVIPVSQGDHTRLPKKIELFEKLGGWKHHSILISAAPSVAAYCSGYLDRLKNICPDSTVYTMSNEPEGGWPRACNLQFVDTVMALARMGNNKPWFWMELDCDPIRKGWQDALETGYNVGAKPFFGHVRSTAEVTTPPQDGSHMVGCGLYPANFHTIAAAEYRAIPPKEPFDVSLRWRVMRSGVTATALIDHHHASNGYALTEDSKLTFIDAENPIDLEPIAVIHGCKDDSLTDLVLSGALDHLSNLAPEPVQQVVIRHVAAPDVPVEVTLKNQGWRSPLAGVWISPMVTDIQIIQALQTTEVPEVAAKPATKEQDEMDKALANMTHQTAFVPRVTTNFPEGVGADAPPEAVIVPDPVPVPDNSPESGADNATPPVHTATEDAGHQGESSDDSSLTARSSEAAPSGGSQTGHPVLNELTLRIARKGKPTRIREWAEELQLPQEELRSLIRSHPESGLSIATAGWVNIS